ncbi:MAG: rnd [Acidobacteria bacterium]|nr:rnd [Acidobacteriota bacterium]
MSPAALPPPILIADAENLDRLVAALAVCDAVAVDTESNSLHAYRERVCLIQFSTADADYIVDPLALPDLSRLAPFFANPAQQKVFHAAEYDLLCLRRDYQFDFVNIFDTMSTARTLGWPQVGLAAILDAHFGVTMNKKYQRADWKRRPLTAEQLDYARLDTHYLVPLRDKQIEALTAAGRLPEAQEEFARLARLRPEPEHAAPVREAFWRVKGARELTPPQAAVLQTLFAYREQQAERIDRPPFKVMGEATLMDLVRRLPRRTEDLHGVPGMTPDQIQRHGRGVLEAIRQGIDAPAPLAPQIEREPDAVQNRYDRLHTWRKERAKARGVESDVILPRSALWDLARRPPRSVGELAAIADFGPWRRDTYGAEIVALLRTIAVIIATLAVLGGAVAAQERKPVPKDSMRVSIPGCTKGYIFTAGRRTVDEPGSVSVPEGTHFRMNGPKKMLAEIKAQEGSMIELTGLTRKGQYTPGGVGVGGGVRVGPGPRMGGGTPGGSPVADQISIDVEGWRPIEGGCPTR